MGATLNSGQRISYSLGEGRMAYIVPATGELKVNGVAIQSREGVAVREDKIVEIEALNDAEILLIDVA
jgi:quercetin 2,3-dioxygenase